MNSFHLGALLLTAYLGVFWEATPGGLRNWLGAQVDFLPCLIVYCGLSTGLFPLTLTALLGGLWFDSLSANPLGISVFPLFLTGLTIYLGRDLVLRDQFYARLLLGLTASAAVPFLVVLLLWGGGYRPLIGWGSLWQWLVLTVGGGILTPVCFWFFDRLQRALAYSHAADSPFRTDREIKRGRV